MKIAVSCSGTDKDSLVDSRFGRAKSFMIIDTENDTWEYIENSQNLNAAQGAGIQSAQNVVDKGADAVITGHCGPKAFKVLNAAEISIYLGAEGTVSDAVEKLKKGELTAAKDADVEGHWA